MIITKQMVSDLANPRNDIFYSDYRLSANLFKYINRSMVRGIIRLAQVVFVLFSKCAEN